MQLLFQCVTRIPMMNSIRNVPCSLLFTCQWHSQMVRINEWFIYWFTAWVSRCLKLLQQLKVSSAWMLRKNQSVHCRQFLVMPRTIYSIWKRWVFYLDCQTHINDDHILCQLRRNNLKEIRKILHTHSQWSSIKNLNKQPTKWWDQAKRHIALALSIKCDSFDVEYATDNL